MQASDLLTQGDGLSRALAWLLLAMSVASWVVILWKGWLLHRARNDLARACAAFWQAPSLAEAQQRVAGFDRAGLLLPLVQAATAPAPGSLDAQADAALHPRTVGEVVSEVDGVAGTTAVAAQVDALAGVPRRQKDLREILDKSHLWCAQHL